MHSYIHTHKRAKFSERGEKIFPGTFHHVLKGIVSYFVLSIAE